MHFARIESVGLINLQNVVYIAEDRVRFVCNSTAAITPKEYEKIVRYIEEIMGKTYDI